MRLAAIKTIKKDDIFNIGITLSRTVNDTLQDSSQQPSWRKQVADQYQLHGHTNNRIIESIVRGTQFTLGGRHWQGTFFFQNYIVSPLFNTPAIFNAPALADD